MLVSRAFAYCNNHLTEIKVHQTTRRMLIQQTVVLASMIAGHGPACLSVRHDSTGIDFTCSFGAGLAIRDFWGVDDDTVVFVADPSLGNILNFNVGSSIDLRIPRVS